jgi:NAD(P)-dependent dehydrogenase (short-subunit alcohol dehydrogenase family)
MTPKTILITGASTGFGKLTASLLLQQGHRVIAALRGGEARLRELYTDEEVSGGGLTALDLHMERPETFGTVRALIEERFDGRLDVLINNAGYAVIGPMEEQSEETIRHQLEVNTVGPMLLTNQLLPVLHAARGRILNVSSVVARISLPFYALYSASKFAVEGYSEGLAYDLRPFGVQVGLVEPGGFNTEFSPTASKATALVAAGSRYEQRSKAIHLFFSKKAAKMTADPMIVARRLAKLCVRKRVPLRTLLGTDAKVMVLLRWLLPDRLRLWLVDRGFSKLMFEGN